MVDRVLRLASNEALLFGDVAPTSLPGHDPATADAVLDALARVTHRLGGEVLYRNPGSSVARFNDVRDALVAAIGAQRLAGPAKRATVAQSRLRLAVHTYDTGGIPARTPTATVDEVVSMGQAGHGGQVLVSHAARDAVRDVLPPGAHLVDIGLSLLDGFEDPRRLFRLTHPDLLVDDSDPSPEAPT